MPISAPLIDQAVSLDSDHLHSLVGEHERLMRDVDRRAAPVQALLSARVWPHADLGALTSFLRTEVLRQVSDEEVHLFPNDACAPPFAELSTDHLRLRDLTAQLEKARAEPCSRTELRGLLDELLRTLRRHLADEQQVLAALAVADGEVPAVAYLAATNQAWLPDHSPVRIELDTLRVDQATELCIERMLRLTPGQTAEVHASNNLLLHTVGRWLREFDPARFGLDQMATGDDHLLRVTCRHANTPAGIGYPAAERHSRTRR